jgi:hypothetical protein
MTAVVASDGRMAATTPRGESSFISIFFLVIWWAFAYIAQPDSPRMAVPVGAGVRMPGSFGFGFDDDEAELDELVVRVRKLGVKGKE